MCTFQVMHLNLPIISPQNIHSHDVYSCTIFLNYIRQLNLKAPKIALPRANYFLSWALCGVVWRALVGNKIRCGRKDEKNAIFFVFFVFANNAEI